MTNNECSTILESASVRPTSIRILVYKTMIKIHDTFSLSELENVLESVDKSSIFRTLTLFHKHNLIHSVDDGSGYSKYCLCHNHGECQEEEVHCHFYCDTCQKTYCLEEGMIPKIELPVGFLARKLSYMVKGICLNCSSKKI